MLFNVVNCVRCLMDGNCDNYCNGDVEERYGRCCYLCVEVKIFIYLIMIFVLDNYCEFWYFWFNVRSWEFGVEC